MANRHLKIFGHVASNFRRCRKISEDTLIRLHTMIARSTAVMKFLLLLCFVLLCSVLLFFQLVSGEQILYEAVHFRSAFEYHASQSAIAAREIEMCIIEIAQAGMRLTFTARKGLLLASTARKSVPCTKINVFLVYSGPKEALDSQQTKVLGV